MYNGNLWGLDLTQSSFGASATGATCQANAAARLEVCQGYIDEWIDGFPALIRRTLEQAGVKLVAVDAPERAADFKGIAGFGPRVRFDGACRTISIDADPREWESLRSGRLIAQRASNWVPPLHRALGQGLHLALDPDHWRGASTCCRFALRHLDEVSMDIGWRLADALLGGVARPQDAEHARWYEWVRSCGVPPAAALLPRPPAASTLRSAQAVPVAHDPWRAGCRRPKGSKRKDQPPPGKS